MGVADRRIELLRDGVNGPCSEVLLGSLEDSWCTDYEKVKALCDIAYGDALS